MIENVSYADAGHTAVAATIDGLVVTRIRLDGDGYRSRQVLEWIAAGNTPAAYVAPPALAAVIDGAVFLQRMTDDEYAAILAASATQLAGGNGLLARWIDILRMKGVVNLGDPVALAAKTGLVAAGLLAAARADAVFAAPD
jgi:hypothetical protein